VIEKIVTRDLPKQLRNGSAGDCDTVLGLKMCFCRALKLLIEKVLRKLYSPCHRTWQDTLPGICLRDASYTGTTIDTCRCRSRNVTDLGSLPDVESTRVGGVSGSETMSGGPRRIIALA